MRVDEALLCEIYKQAPIAGETLLIGGSSAWAGAMAATAFSRDATVSWLPLDVRERVVNIAGSTVLDDPGNPLFADARFGAIIFPAPPERDLGRRWLMLAREHLQPGGSVILAGANATGIRSTIGDARALFGPPLREDFGSKQRIATFRVGELPEMLPAWANTPGIAPRTWAELSLDIDGVPATLATLPGVFAGSRLDAGTELLLAQLDVQPGERVLDVGCGAGVIGLTALRRGAGEVVMTDVNLLAVAAVRETIRRGVRGDARVVAGDVYDGVASSDRFDLIVSNPPFHQGKSVDYGMPQRLIEEAAKHLAPSGRLVIVANAFLSYERLLEERFRVVTELANTRRFKVLMATRPR